MDEIHQYHNVGEEDEHEDVSKNQLQNGIQWSMFDLNIGSIDVTLSLRRWLDGNGLLEDVVVKGVRGVLGTLFCRVHMTCVDSSLQTAAPSVGTRSILSILPCFGIRLGQEILNSSPSNWRTSLSVSTSLANSVHLRSLSSAQISDALESNGFCTISYERRISLVNSTIACSACIDRKVSGGPLRLS